MSTELDEHSERIIKVRILMQDREKARKTNDFGKSDQIRDKLLEKYGVIVKDQVGGPSGWKFKDGSTRKLSSGAIVPEEAKKKRNREEEDSGSSKKKKDARDHARADPTAPGSSTKKSKKEKTTTTSSAPETQKNKKILESVVGPSGGGVRNVQGIIIEEIKVGIGKIAESGKRCKMGYVGRLKSNGKMFDASGNKPFTFRLGRSEVIRGWDIGVEGMREGGKRRLTIPPEKAYGRQGAPPTIPGNATLVFEVSVIEVK